ncbi:hypothetical protein BDF20DRAFT_896083 [Mycotypha africana]|uniref:uncharacterized protein n=1 Tax=Mycotypha africana TaxID=64632 RepID=UPI0023000F05|nr:uncharacterized protein BDF20DRAFT_896083 [Mycotypha africana]KAI8968391.1 hypothetical protein BDF20DRAFT_896083 [Mycotypha africana]
MLNPFAHEFKPLPSFQTQPTETAITTSSTSKQQSDEQRQRQKQQDKQKSSRTATITKETESSQSNNDLKAKKKKPIVLSSTTLNKKSNKKSESQQTQTVSPSLKKQQHSRRKSSQQNTTSVTITPLTDQFSEETKFITIEAAIDPIHRIAATSTRNSNLGSSCTSISAVTNDGHRFEHGYERYIRWIEKSLRKFDTITVVGMDNAVVDVVSLVTIIHDRKIGIHNDIETFSMKSENNKRIAGCIQVKLHSYY